jgi:hypothetical protein
MERIYKLIKEYPGSPPKNTLVYKYSNFDELIFEYRDIYSIICTKSNMVEDFPEYWERQKAFVTHTKNGLPIYEGDNCYAVCDKRLTIDYIENITKNQLETTYFKEKYTAQKYVKILKKAQEKIKQLK